MRPHEFYVTKPDSMNSEVVNGQRHIEHTPFTKITHMYIVLFLSDFKFAISVLCLLMLCFHWYKR